MITKAEIKEIRSLQEKKTRREKKKFVIEGEKIVRESIEWKSDCIEVIYHIASYSVPTHLKINCVIITEKELESISSLKTPNKVLAVCTIQIQNPIESTFCIALDDIQDPGNLGTIIRLADWFGIKQILCSETTVDCYNPKVIQATMGGVFRTNICYLDLVSYLSNTSKPILGGLLIGENAFTFEYPKEGIILLGNEGSGISEELKKVITHSITIPKFGDAESLNVASAASIMLGSLFQYHSK